MLIKLFWLSKWFIHTGSVYLQKIYKNSCYKWVKNDDPSQTYKSDHQTTSFLIKNKLKKKINSEYSIITLRIQILKNVRSICAASMAHECRSPLGHYRFVYYYLLLLIILFYFPIFNLEKACYIIFNACGLQTPFKIQSLFVKNQDIIFMKYLYERKE